MPVQKKAATKKKTAAKSTAKSTTKKSATEKKSATTAAKKAVKKPVKKAVTKKSTTAASKTAKKTTASKTTKAKTATKAKTTTKVAAKAKSSTTKPEARSTSKRKRTLEESGSVTFLGIPPYQEKKGEEYMNEAQREHVRKILGAWRQILMEEVDRTVTHMKDEASNFPDPSDRASQEEEFSLELRTRDRERKLIKKIEDSLENLKSEDFGYCETCGIEIGIRRLEARPTATLCIDCKTLSEIKERQDTGG